MGEKDNISLIVGSGLSVPFGFPTCSEINNRFRSIKQSDIIIYSSGSAAFLNGRNDPNANHMRVAERHFVERFIKFYCENILSNREKFHYETFFDYYQDLISSNSFNSETSNFFERYKSDFHLDNINQSILYDFDNTYNQLLAHLLYKRFCRGHLCKPYDPKYNNFLILLEELSKNFIVNIHSLNHDLYIEHLSYSDSIQNQLDDGFSELNSSYYADLLLEDERYTVRLRKFVDKYDKKFRLYKLHGSIDNYLIRDNDENVLIKTKRRIGPKKIKKEIGCEGKLSYKEYRSIEYYAEFLSGAIFKVGKYNETYYKKMFEHFENNLKSSKILIFIGYGFNDDGINKIIKENARENTKKVFIVDIKNPNTQNKIGLRYQFLRGGVENFDYKIILNNI